MADDDLEEMACHGKVIDDYWYPCLDPPFSTLDCGEFGECVCDNYGRTIIIEHRNGEFVEELCKVMNENKERLVDAWKRNKKSCE